MSDDLALEVSKYGRKISALLPLSFGEVAVPPLTWNQFSTQPEESPYSAHIYWNITYQIIDRQKKKVIPKLTCLNRSWVKQQRKCQHLLNHQQGHLMIGALCMLEFMRRIHTNKSQIQPGNYEQFVSCVFNRTIRQYLQLERRYDYQTEHRLNGRRQDQWDFYIWGRLKFYRALFDNRKSKFKKIKKKK